MLPIKEPLSVYTLFSHRLPKYGYGSIPINTIFRGMNIHLPAILMFTKGTRFWHTAIFEQQEMRNKPHEFRNPIRSFQEQEGQSNQVENCGKPNDNNVRPPSYKLVYKPQ